MTHPAPLTLLTDFGTADAFVGIMKGVIASICPQVTVIDLTHAVPPQQVRAGALVLRSAVDFFPTGAIHVAVVDPGVGAARRPILVETERALLIGPDNGLLAPAAAHLGRRRIRCLENQLLFRHPVSQTFHGRDIFAPVAAHLACGVDAERVGPPIDDMVDLALAKPACSAARIDGEVVYADRFGNLVTNIDEPTLMRFPAHAVSVSINGTPVAGPVAAYAAVPDGVALAIVGSWGALEIAVRNGSAAAKFAAGPGTPVTVVWESRDA